MAWAVPCEAIVPRGVESAMEFVVISVAKPGRDAAAIARRTRGFVDAALVDDEERVVHDIEEGAMHVLVVDRPKSYVDQRLDRRTGRVGVVRGYVTDQAWSPTRTLDDLDRGRIESPGGIYSALVADLDRERVALWISHGNVEALFWAEGVDAWFAGTNPLAVHCLAQRDHRVRLDPDWARHVLVPGSTLFDDTPFLGVRMVEARRRVVLERRGPIFGPHPVDIELGPSGRTIRELMRECRRAIAVSSGYPDVRLSLSGGKDSRAALALLLGAGLRPEAFTSGLEGQGEVVAAAAVARRARVPHVVVPKTFAKATEFWPVVFSNLRQSDGLLSENRHLVHVGAESVSPVEVHGQAHHLRGGYMTRGKYDHPDLVRDSAYGRFAKSAVFCDPLIGAETRSAIDEYLAGIDVPRRGLELYWIYGDLRMARWLQAGLHRRRKRQLLIWPFLDERVLQVAAGLTVRERVQEIAQYDLIVRSAPRLAGLPLYESQWKFDQRAGRRKVRPWWRPARMRAFVDDRSVTLGPQTASTIGLVVPYVRTALNDFSFGPELLDSLSPAWRDLANGGMPDELIGVAGRFPLFSFMWRIVALSAVMSGEWLPPRIELAR